MRKKGVQERDGRRRLIVEKRGKMVRKKEGGEEEEEKRERERERERER